MSDLISRSALLKKICKTFNIPDDWDGDIAEPLQTIIDIIENQPIAYDKEAVVEQLEEQSDYEPIDYDYCDMSCSGEEHFIETHKAIDIVKAGRIDG